MDTTQAPVSATTLTAAEPRTRPRPRRFYVGMGLLMIVIVLGGFWPSYFGPLFRGATVEWPWVIHLHVASNMGWLALLSAQALLVSTGRTRTHMKLGSFGIAYGIFVILVGLAVSIVLPLHHLSVDHWEMDRAAQLLLVGCSDLAVFVILFGAAIAYRRRPEIHKRLMVLAAAALIMPGAGRLAIAIFGFKVLMILFVWLSPVLMAMGHDVLTRRRVHPAYLVGTPILLFRVVWQFLVIESEPALAVGRNVLTMLLGDAVR
jgi:hypothetical protein